MPGRGGQEGDKLRLSPLLKMYYIDFEFKPTRESIPFYIHHGVQLD